MLEPAGRYTCVLELICYNNQYVITNTLQLICYNQQVATLCSINEGIAFGLEVVVHILVITY